MMRTTLTLDDDVYEAVRQRAFDQRRPIGDVVSELTKRGLAAESEARPRRKLGFWAALVPDRLGIKVANILKEPGSVVFVSSVSIAEMSIKTAHGKMGLPEAPIELCRELGARPLALTWEHAQQLSSLPTMHRDPFDRLLIAQAMVEDLTLITADARILPYPNVQQLAN